MSKATAYDLARARAVCLVGRPYEWAQPDAAIGVDCLSLVAEVWRIIGQETNDRTRWEFPLPAGYPASMDGRRLTTGELAAWADSFIEIREPRFGALADLGRDHCGVVIDVRPCRILHAAEGRGVILQPLERLRRVFRGFYVKREASS